jgi:hypothetical protein
MSGLANGAGHPAPLAFVKCECLAGLVSQDQPECRMRVIVGGATAWTDAEAIRRELLALPAGSTIIHGDAPGADALAGEVAVQLGLAVERFGKNKEDYRKYRRAAWKGLNERMLASGAELVLAFHPDIEKSRGTGHLVEIARRARVQVRIISG